MKLCDIKVGVSNHLIDLMLVLIVSSHQLNEWVYSHGHFEYYCHDFSVKET